MADFGFHPQSPFAILDQVTRLVVGFCQWFFVDLDERHRPVPGAWGAQELARLVIFCPPYLSTRPLPGVRRVERPV